MHAVTTYQCCKYTTHTYMHLFELLSSKVRPSQLTSYPGRTRVMSGDTLELFYCLTKVVRGQRLVGGA